MNIDSEILLKKLDELGAKFGVASGEVYKAIAMEGKINGIFTFFYFIFWTAALAATTAWALPRWETWYVTGCYRVTQASIINVAVGVALSIEAGVVLIALFSLSSAVNAIVNPTYYVTNYILEKLNGSD